jgi:hypothetical protein
MPTFGRNQVIFIAGCAVVLFGSTLVLAWLEPEQAKMWIDFAPDFAWKSLTTLIGGSALVKTATAIKGK